MPLVDFSSVDKQEAIEPQKRLPAALEKFENGIAESGDAKVDLTFVCTEGPYQGRKFFKAQSLGQKSLPYLRRVLIALGYPQDQIDVPDFDTDQAFPMLIGAPCSLEITKSEWDGEMRNNVKNVRPPVFATADSGAGASANGF